MRIVRIGFVALAVAIVTAAVIVFFTHYRDATVSSAEAPTKPTIVSLRLNGTFDPVHAGEVVAARAGLFQREGLHVEVRPGGNGLDPIRSVTNGTDTFGIADSHSFLVARSKGAPIVAFGASYLESPTVFFVLEKSGIRTPQDFVGKRVAREAGKDSAIIYDTLLAKLGLSRSQMREVSVGAGIAALLNHEIDVLPGRVGEVSYLLHQKGVQFTVIRPSDYGIHVPGTVFFTTEKTIHDHPSTVQRFLKAVIAGWNQTYADYFKSIPLFVTAGDNVLAPDQVQYELAAQRDFVLPLARRVAEFDSLQWKQLRTVLLNERLINDSLDLSRAVNYDFLKEAYRKPISFGN